MQRGQPTIEHRLPYVSNVLLPKHGNRFTILGLHELEHVKSIIMPAKKTNTKHINNAVHSVMKVLLMLVKQCSSLHTKPRENN